MVVEVANEKVVVMANNGFQTSSNESYYLWGLASQTLHFFTLTKGVFAKKRKNIFCIFWKYLA